MTDVIFTNPFPTQGRTIVVCICYNSVLYRNNIYSCQLKVAMVIRGAN